MAGDYGVQLSKPAQVLLGVMTLWVFAYGIAFFIVVSSARGGALPVATEVFAALHVLTALDVAVLYATYWRHASRNPALGARRKRWLSWLLYGGPFAWPVYWLRHVWRARRAGPRRGRPDAS